MLQKSNWKENLSLRPLQKRHLLISVGCLFRNTEFLVPFNKTGIFDTWPGSFRRHITCCWVYVVVLILSVSNPPCLTKQCEHVCVAVRNESASDNAPFIAKCLCKAGFKPNATDTSQCIRKCSNIKCIVCLPDINNFFEETICYGFLWELHLVISL